MLMKPAGFLSLFLGLGFGLPCVFAIRHLAQTGEVWTFMGFPTYGRGPFERIGVHTTIALLACFLSVCLVEVVVGLLLCVGTPYGPATSYALLPFELAFWVGFALPVGPLLGMARTGLVLVARGRRGHVIQAHVAETKRP
jgi:hypothetical protein